MSSSLAYTEPAPLPLLITTSFILLLNIINSLLDRLIYCGLIGQIFVGVAFGTPGAGLLGLETERVVGLLGYLGLVGVVYEGGLSTTYRTLALNLPLSLSIAATGISLPIALSYTLPHLLSGTPGPDVTPLQAFAAGAALCSTSLGTTFTVLASCGLIKTRLGVVLSTAAMLDDVVGLVMVQVMTNLGEGGITAVTVVRPILVSVAFAILVPAFAMWVVRPVTVVVNGWRDKRGRNGLVERVLGSREFVFLVHTLFLVGMVVGSSYAGTSDLFAAWLAGACVSWWDGEVPHVGMRGDAMPVVEVEMEMEMEARGGGDDLVDGGELTPGETRPVTQRRDRSPDDRPSRLSSEPKSTSGIDIFTKYYSPTLQRILKPFFFASIGFSIPIKQMFQPSIIWRGIVYSILMFIAKLACGLWLVRLPTSTISWWSSLREVFGRGQRGQDRKKSGFIVKDMREESMGEGDRVVGNGAMGKRAMYTDEMVASATAQQTQYQRDEADERSRTKPEHTHDHVSSPAAQHRSPVHETPSSIRESTKSRNGTQHDDQNQRPNPTRPRAPISLYPALILGSAMTARGEIGFLISSLAQSNGIFDGGSSSSSSSSPSSNPSLSSSSNSSSDSTGNTDINTNTDPSPAIFLIVTWAIMLCTIVGPIAVGVLVRRVRRLERDAGSRVCSVEERKGMENGTETETERGRRRGRDVLGVWGVD